jgi:hypothetical protein
MSKITDAFDALQNKIKAVLPAHIQIPNPYKPEENNEQQLTKGWGLRIGGGENTQRALNCQMSIRRSFILVLTRKVRANEMNIGGKESAHKQIFEDQALVIKALESDPSLGMTSIANAIFTDDNGLEYVFTDKDNFVKLESTVQVEYFENI